MASGLKVLMVEDSEDEAHFIQEEIRKGGHELSAFRVDSADAMRTALLQKDWDLVLSDHSMPGFSAPAALKILQESGVDVPFIIVSGAISEEMAVSLMRAGARDFVMKDQLGRLVPAIAREIVEARNRQQYRRLEQDHLQTTRRVEQEHAWLEQKETELGALNRLFQQQISEMDQTKSENQALLKQFGGMILSAVEERHQSGQLPASLPGARDRPTAP